MQKEKGVTLISVTIYIIVMLIIVSVITVITSYFYNNVDVNAVSQDINQQYTRFNSYFTEEINKKGNKVIDIQSISTTGTEGEIESNTNQQNYIVFSSGNQYTYIPANKGIYMNNVKIAQNIKDCTFTMDKLDNGKTTITVIIQGDNFLKETTYTLVE